MWMKTNVKCAFFFIALHSYWTEPWRVNRGTPTAHWIFCKNDVFKLQYIYLFILIIFGTVKISVISNVPKNYRSVLSPVISGTSQWGWRWQFLPLSLPLYLSCACNTALFLSLACAFLLAPDSGIFYLIFSHQGVTVSVQETPGTSRRLGISANAQSRAQYIMGISQPEWIIVLYDSKPLLCFYLSFFLVVSLNMCEQYYS